MRPFWWGFEILRLGGDQGVEAAQELGDALLFGDEWQQAAAPLIEQCSSAK
jgi:hypothetical protein